MFHPFPFLEHPFLSQKTCFDSSGHSFFTTVYFELHWPATLSLFDRLLLSPTTVQFPSFGPSSCFFSDRQLFDFKTLHFRRLSTLDRTLMTLPDVPKRVWICIPKMTLAQFPFFGGYDFHHVISHTDDVT